MYYGILVVVVFLALASMLVKTRAEKMLLFYLAVFLLLLVNGLRDPFIYPDNISYFDFYKGDFYVADEGTLNVGYLFFNWLLGKLTPHFQVFCFIVATILTCSYAKLITRYSPYIWLSLLLYILINYLPSFFLLRQYLAMPFVFMSFKYVIRRDQLKYWICVLLAFSIHTTALIVIPLYYVYGLRYCRKNMFLIAAGTVLASVGFMAVGAIIGKMFSYYAQYVEMEVEDPAWQRALMKIYILGVYIFALRKSFYRRGINRLVFYAMLFNIVICIGAMNIYGVFRLREFFSFADFIGIPVILSYYRKPRRKRVRYVKVRRKRSRLMRVLRALRRPAVIMMTAVYIGLLILSYVSFVNGGNMENGFRFFWENDAYPI